MQKEAMLQACSHINEVQSAASILASTSQDSSQSEDNAFLAACAEFKRITLLPFGVFRAAAGCDSDNRNLEFAAGPSAPARVPSPVLSTAVDSCSLATQQQVHEDETLLSVATTAVCTNVFPQCLAARFQRPSASDARSPRRRRRTNPSMGSSPEFETHGDLCSPEQQRSSYVGWRGTPLARGRSLEEIFASQVLQQPPQLGVDVDPCPCDFQAEPQRYNAQQLAGMSARTQAIVLRRSVAVDFATQTARISALVIASHDAVAALREGEALSLVVSHANTAVLRDFLLQRKLLNQTFEDNFLARALSGEFIAPALLSAELEDICDTAVTDLSIGIQNAACELRNIDADIETKTKELEILGSHKTHLQRRARKASWID